MRKIPEEEFNQTLCSCVPGKQYLELIQNAREYENRVNGSSNNVLEKHHIHPRALGGKLKAKSNIVGLTVYDHIVAHILLAKIFECPETLFAVHILSGRQVNSLTDLEKTTLDELYNWTEIRQKANLSNKGKHISEEHRKKISRSRKGIVFSKEHKENLSKSHSGKVYLYTSDGSRLSCDIGDKQFYLDSGRYFESKRVSINDGNVEKKVPELVLNRYLAEGWKQGRAQKNLEIFRTDEHRQMVSKIHRGKHLSEEQKRYISKIHKGKQLSEEHRKKLSEAKKGKHLSESHRKNISIARKGMQFSEEHIRSIVEANRNKVYLYSPEGKRTVFKLEEKQDALNRGYIESKQIDVNNGTVGKKIPEFLLEQYLQCGWKIGQNRHGRK